MQQKFLVSGSNGKALYDFEKGKVFKLNKAEAEKFKQFAYNETDLKPLLAENNEIGLKFANLELTSQCNLKCKHCYGGKNFGKKEKELDTKQWKKIINELSKFKPKSLLFTGGEATLRKDLTKLLYYTHSIGIKTSLFSNLISISQKQAKALKETDCLVQFSAYGHKAKMHDFVTGIQGSFEKQQTSLKKLKELGVRLRGQVIILKENQYSKNKIKKHFKELNIPIEFSIARPGGRQNASNIPGCITCSFPKGYIKARGKPASLSFDYFVLKQFYNNCWARRCGITATGKVIACVFDRDKILGDLTKESFKQIYEKMKTNAEKYSCGKIKDCKDCSLRFACVDCRPWAFSLTGNWLAKNPYCKELT